MGGLAESLHPSDLPAALGASGVGWLAGVSGLLQLVFMGLVMTAVMQSSTAAIAVTLAAYGAGAIELGQGCALIIGQNVGTATSSALAAIGASVTAKRLALAYVLFKLIAALIALMAFAITTPLMQRWQNAVGGLTLLAAYHTAYNVVGVTVLLPAIDWFTRVVERLLPSRELPFERRLDPAALASPFVAVETVRRTVAGVLATLTAAFSGSGDRSGVAAGASRALEEAGEFLSELKVPPETEAEQHRMTSTLHALDRTSRLAEMLSDAGASGPKNGGPDELRAAELCQAVMRSAQAVAKSIAAESALSERALPIGWQATPEAEAALRQLATAAKALDEMQRAYRATTLAAVAPGQLSASEAFDRVDAVRRLDEIAHQAWRSAAHLLGHGA
jgi:phosphate:Na+ symporter